MAQVGSFTQPDNSPAYFIDSLEFLDKREDIGRIRAAAAKHLPLSVGQKGARPWAAELAARRFLWRRLLDRVGWPPPSISAQPKWRNSWKSGVARSKWRLFPGLVFCAGERNGLSREQLFLTQVAGAVTLAKKYFSVTEWNRRDAGMDMTRAGKSSRNRQKWQTRLLYRASARNHHQPRWFVKPRFPKYWLAAQKKASCVCRNTPTWRCNR